MNVRGERALLDAIKRCFGSLWSERAIDYRARQGLQAHGDSLGSGGSADGTDTIVSK